MQSFILNLTSEEPERLHAFYREVVGLRPAQNAGPMAVEAGGAVITFDGHSTAT